MTSAVPKGVIAPAALIVYHKLLCGLLFHRFPLLESAVLRGHGYMNVHASGIVTCIHVACISCCIIRATATVNSEACLGVLRHWRRDLWAASTGPLGNRGTATSLHCAT